MALDPLGTWDSEFEDKLKPVSLQPLALLNLAQVVGALTDKVQCNAPPPASATQGIFKFNQATFIAQLLSLLPTVGPEWAQKVALAWTTACSSSIITPGTVTNPTVWTASTVDAVTVPAAAATIPTIAAGQALVLAGVLASSTALVDANLARKLFAGGFRAGAGAFTFIVIGLVNASPAPPVPTPLVFPAI